MALVTLPQVEQIVVCFLHHYARVAASPFPILSGGRLAEHESSGAYRR
jgi:hypothetical protein